MSAQIPSHGGQLRAIAARFGVEAEGLLDFSANINPEGPPAGVLARLRARLEDVSVLTSYPDLEQTDLKHALARSTGLAAENIAAANGFVPLFEAALRALSIRRCLLPVPAFNEYRRTLARMEVEAAPIQLRQEENFRYDAVALLATAMPGDALLLANPQNPSGVAHDRAAMIGLAIEAASKGVRLLLDEAFIDYLPEASLTRDATAHSGLIVFRSVTKFHGIPGMRVAYAAASAGIVSSIDEHLPPWPVTTLAADAAVTALDDDAYAERARQLNRRRRGELERGLHALGVVTYPAAANYLLLRVPGDATALWERLIREHGIVLRDCSDYETLGAGHLRLAVRTEDDNARLLEAFGRLLG